MWARGWRASPPPMSLTPPIVPALTSEAFRLSSDRVTSRGRGRVGRVLAWVGLLAVAACAGGSGPTAPADADAVVGAGPSFTATRDSMRSRVGTGGAGGTGVSADRGQTPIWW